MGNRNSCSTPASVLSICISARKPQDHVDLILVRNIFIEVEIRDERAGPYFLDGALLKAHSSSSAANKKLTHDCATTSHT